MNRYTSPIATPPPLEIYTPAKLNLSLHISGKKIHPPFVGYHLIESLVSFVNIYDKITLTPNTQGTITISVSGDFAPHIPHTTDNLVARAIHMIRPDISYGCQVHIEKNLPVGGGIGGGASNAGGTIRALSSFWNIDIPDAVQMASLGADIPMCVRQQEGFITGIGDVFAPVSLPPFFGVIAFPHTQVMTGDIYKHFATHGTFSTTYPPPENMDYKSLIQYLQQGQNDLMPICVSLYPEVQKCLHIIQNTHADYVNISGSGACCFGIYNSIKTAQNALNTLIMHNFWAKIATKI